jgi:hypothetical protein
MNHYIFEKASETAIRLIWIESDEDNIKSVTNIYELRTDGSFESLKHAVKCLFSISFIGENGDYEVKVAGLDYDPSLEGKARKRTSKEINVISVQLKGL